MAPRLVPVIYTPVQGRDTVGTYEDPNGIDAVVAAGPAWRGDDGSLLDSLPVSDVAPTKSYRVAGFLFDALPTRGAGWWTSPSYLAPDAANDNRLPAIICDFRKDQYAKPRLLANFRNTGALSSFGTVTPPTYSTSTGAGIAYRVDASNQSGVQFAAIANKVYELDLEAGPNGIITRSGTSLAGSIAHNGLGANVRQKVYLVSIGPLIFIAANANGTTCSYTLHSIREVDTATMEAATFADLFAFTRAGTATYIDQAGKMQVAANDVPRFDYSSGVRQLLNEGPVTNLATYSDDPSNAAGWSNTAAFTVGGFPDPFGGNTAGEYTAPNNAAVAPKVITSGGRAAGVAVRFYFYSTENQLWSFLLRNNTQAVNFNSRTLNVSTFSQNPVGFTDTINGWTCKYLGNNWVEVSTIQTTGMANNDTMWVYFGQTGSNLNGKKFRIAKMDFFSEPKLSSHIVTTSSALARAADSYRMSPMVEAILQRTEASMLVQGKLLSIVAGEGNQVLLGGANVAGNPALLLAHGATANGVGTWNGTQALWAVGSTNLSASPFGAGTAFSAAGRSAAVNGGAAANDNLAAGDRTQIYLGRSATGAYGNGWYDQLVIWPFRMTNAALQGKAVAYAA